MAGYVIFTGVEHNYVSISRTADVSFLGDMDLISCVAIPSLTPTSRVSLQNQHRARDNQRSWRFSIEPSGAPSFWWSKAGKVAGTEVVAGDIVGSFATVNESFWTRITHQVNNGNNRNVIDFYWSLDLPRTAPAAVTWTLLDSQTRPQAVTHFDSEARIQLGALNAGNRDMFTGRYYRAWGSGVIGGTPEYNINFGAMTAAEKDTATFTDGRGRPVTIHMTDLGNFGAQDRIVRDG